MKTKKNNGRRLAAAVIAIVLTVVSGALLHKSDSSQLKVYKATVERKPMVTD